MRLDKLGLQIGNKVQIQLLDDEAKKYNVQLIGYSAGHGLILTAPKTAGTDLSMILREDQPLNVWIKTINSKMEFRSQIIEKRLTPFAQILISYPKDRDQLQFEKIEIIDLDQGITFINEDEDSRSTQATLTGISKNQARVAYQETLASKGHRATITLSFRFAGKNNVIVLDGVVDESNYNSTTKSHELILSYEELDQSDKILLHAYIYECMLIYLKILEG